MSPTTDAALLQALAALYTEKAATLLQPESTGKNSALALLDDRIAAIQRMVKP